jgi:hypothetical protein
MSDLKIAVPGEVFQTELSTTQVPIALGAGGLFAVTNNVATITFNSAHGLTFTPAAGVAPNFFIQFNGVTGQTGVGTLNGPIFLILAIPSTTTIQIYTTVTAATMTAANAVPVFIPTATPTVGSVFAGGPSNAGVVTQGPLQATGNINYLLGPNCTIQYNPDNTSQIQGPTTINAGSTTPGQTLATAPTFRISGAVSTGGQQWMDGTGQIAIFASGSAGTSRFSVIE